MKRLLILVAMTLVLTPHQTNAQSKISATALKACRDSVARFMKKGSVAGVSVSIFVRGDVVLSEGFGFADLEQKVKIVPSQTRFRIGSISKSMTATALALLLQQHKVVLDSSINYYVPDFPKKKFRPTVRQLGGHIAGIRSYAGDEFYNKVHYSTVMEGLGMFRNDSLLFAPGARYEYSTHGFNLLSAVLEKASGKPFIQLMQETVWRPLNMKNTGPDYVDSLIAGRSRFYDHSPKGWINSPYVDNSYKWAGGGFLSTSEDVLRLGQAYLSTDLLKKETIDVLTTSQKLTDGKETGYGIGWATGKDSKGRVWFGHSGGSVGGTCDLIIYPKEKIIVAALTNQSNTGVYDLTRSIALLLLP